MTHLSTKYLSTKKYLFASERLGFRTWCESDYEPMTAINADPEVMKYFPTPASPEQTTAFINRMKAQFKTRGYCYYPVDLLDSNQFIGFIGFSYQDYISEYTPFVDIGWRLSQKFWGKGLATEGAKACLNYGFEMLKLKEVYAIAPYINTYSWHIMENIGMEKIADFIHPKLSGNRTLENVVLYKVSNALIE
jgi:RimJ/RimL family protein N-acetyltransferase